MTSATAPRSPHRTSLWSLALPLSLGLLPLSGMAQSKGPGTRTCPDSSIASVPPSVVVQSVLPPGSTQPTTGTNPTLSPNLKGKFTLNKLSKFNFETPNCPVVKGQLEHWVVEAKDGTKDCYWCTRVKQICPGVYINGLRITNFRHPLAQVLVGDYRDDLALGGIGSDTVTRSSGLGRTITFNFNVGLSTGEYSRWLFLDTDVPAVGLYGWAQLLTSDGGTSDLYKTYAPVP